MPELKLNVTAKRAKELILLGIVDLYKIDPRSIGDAMAHFVIGSGFIGV